MNVSPEPELIRRLKSGENQRLLFYGTSLSVERTPFFWRNCGGSWIKILRSKLSSRFGSLLSVINCSVWGQDSNKALEELENAILTRCPTALWLELGINDADEARGISLALFQRNLDAIIRAARQRLPGCELTFLTMNPAYGKYGRRRKNLDAYYRAGARLARDLGCPVIDLFPVWERLQKENPSRLHNLLPDGLHPNYEAAESLIWPELQTRLSLCQKSDG